MCRVGENIHKRKDGRWEGRIQIMTDSGDKKYKSIYGKTYHEVKRKVMDIRTILYDTTNKKNNEKHLFTDVTQEWLSFQDAKHKGSTLLKYRTIIESHLISEFGKLDVKEITEPMITKFISYKQAHGNLKTKGSLSSSYTKLILIVLTAILDYAANMDYRPALKSSYILKQSTNKIEAKCLNVDAQKILDNHILLNINENTTGVSLALYAGLRIGEICALRWENIDLENGLIYVNHTVSRIKDTDATMAKTKLIIDKPKTENSKRIIPINSKLQQILVEMKSISQSDYVISNNEYFVSPRTFEYRFHKILDRCNIEQINFHGLRHTFATRCIEVGIDIKTLSELLGHASVNITLNTYVHSSLDRKREEIEKLSQIAV